MTKLIGYAHIGLLPARLAARRVEPDNRVSRCAPVLPLPGWVSQRLPTEPDVRLSPHPALHAPLPGGRQGIIGRERPRGRDARSAVAVAFDRDRCSPGEMHSVGCVPPSPVAEPAPDLASVHPPVFTLQPFPDPAPRVKVDTAEDFLGDPVPEIVCPPCQDSIDPLQEVLELPRM
jgi:hypothetical protein